MWETVVAVLSLLTVSTLAPAFFVSNAQRRLEAQESFTWPGSRCYRAEWKVVFFIRAIERWLKFAGFVFGASAAAILIGLTLA